VLYTLFNCAKPLTIDDTAYYYYADHIAQHPTDPYGFSILWYQHPLPANQVLAPPVLPYWWAAALALFGDRPFLWKLWLFPFVLVFVLSLHGLFRRFAPRLAVPLTCMTVFSPTFLPSLNYMLDVPAVALGLAALVLFMRAYDRSDWRLAVGAGLIAGLAMETKYTAFLVPVTMALYAAVRSRRPTFSLGLGAVAAAVAAGVFVACETGIASKYGRSHFLLHLRHNERDLISQVALFAAPLVLLLGSVAPLLGVTGLWALTRQTRWMTRGLVAVAIALAIVATTGSTLVITGHRDWPIPQDWAALPIYAEEVVYFVMGLFVLGVLLVSGVRLVCRRHSGRRRTDWFVVLWLLLEVAGFFVFTPFAAVRRVMGIVIAGTVLVGRLGALTRRLPEHRVAIWALAAANMALGLIFYSVDLRDAWATKQAAESAAHAIRKHDPQAFLWFTGHWGFQFYAERTGMTPIVTDDESRPVRRGDWLVIPWDAVEQQRVDLDPQNVEVVEHIIVEDAVPLRTVRGFYGTSSGAALEHHQGPRVVVTLYRARQTFVPRTPGKSVRPPKTS
jgi:hypothetical protein